MAERNSDHHDIEKWLEALRGDHPPSISPEMLKEAEMLRALIHERAAKCQTPATESDVQRFLFRLKQERVLTVERRNWGWLAAVASVAFVALSLVIMQPWRQGDEGSMDESSVWRGGESAQRIHTNNPDVAASKVEALLRDNGLMVRRMDEAGSVRLQAKIPEEANQLILDLRAEGVAVPKNGNMDVVWSKPK